MTRTTEHKQFRVFLEHTGETLLKKWPKKFFLPPSWCYFIAANPPKFDQVVHGALRLGVLTLSLPEYLMEFCKVTLTFESADETLWCDHLNESSLPVLSHGATCFSKFYKMKFANLLEICLWLHLAEKGLNMKGQRRVNIWNLLSSRRQKPRKSEKQSTYS